MRIIVDADACPVKEIIVRLARKFELPVLMVADTSHEINDGYSEVMTISQGRDAVDIALINASRKGDVVVTQDYGVASMALGKGAYAIHQNGFVFDDSNMDKLLFERHLGQKIRRSGGKTKGPRKRTKEDDINFEVAIHSLLLRILRMN